MRRLLGLLALLTLSAPAHAASVSIAIDRVGPEDFRDDLTIYVTTTVRGAPGERNDVSIQTPDRHHVMVRDALAVLHAGDRCHRRHRHQVVCRVPSRYDTIHESAVTLGDGNDRINVSNLAQPVDIHGGPGDDRIRGEQGEDVLDGGPGDDVIDGGRGYDELDDGPGQDRVSGGPGGDTLLSDGSGPDRLDGGDGRDLLSYAHHREPVVLHVGRHTGGNVTRNIEKVEGGHADDRIIGGPENDALDGGPGDDRIDGGGGHDVILDEAGDNVVDGGPGNDRIESYGGSTLDIACGPGTDHVLTSGATSLVRPDCETTEYQSLSLQPQSVTADRVVMRSTCGYPGSDPVQDVVKLVTPPAEPWWPSGPFGVVVAQGTVPNRKDGNCDAVLTMTDAGRALTRPTPVLYEPFDIGEWTFLLDAPSATPR